jgi:hypothetical protein
MTGCTNQGEVSWSGVAVMRQTAEELSARQGKNNTYFRDKWTKEVIEQIADTIKRLPPSEIALLAEERKKLLEDKEYIYRFRQEGVERAYKEWVSHLKDWLPASPALGMLNTLHLASLERDLNLPSDGSLSERAARIANAVQIRCPLLGGTFNAEASRLAHAITLYHGISDCFYLSTRVICATIIRDEGVRYIRHFPGECDRAVKVIKRVIQLATGRRRTVSSIPQLTSEA